MVRIALGFFSIGPSRMQRRIETGLPTSRSGRSLLISPVGTLWDNLPLEGGAAADQVDDRHSRPQLPGCVRWR